MGYIDIHSHILPAVDDGAINIDEAIALLRQEYALRIFILKPMNLNFIFQNAVPPLKL